MMQDIRMNFQARNQNEKMIKIKIPFKTPSINHLYYHRGNMKILTKEARELKEEIKQIVYKSRVEVEIHENWLTKKGEIKKKDIANREKFLIDSVFAALGMDDKFIFEHSMKKVQDDQEFAVITIQKLGGKMEEDFEDELDLDDEIEEED